MDRFENWKETHTLEKLRDLIKVTHFAHLKQTLKILWLNPCTFHNSELNRCTHTHTPSRVSI